MSRKNHYIEQGQESYRLGRENPQHYNNALKQFNNAVREDPLNEEIYYCKANTLDKLGRLEEALEDLDKAMKLKPQYEEALYAKGLILSKLGKQEEATECFAQVLEINPNNPDVKGMFAYNSEKYQEATNYFNKILAQNPEDVDTLYYMGNTLYNLGQYQEAIEYFSKAEKIMPNFSAALHGQGLINYKLKNYHLASTFFHKAKNYADSRYYIAKMFYDFYEDQRVVNFLGNCNTVKECNIKGLSLYRLKNHWEAGGAFESAISLGKNSAESYVNYANLLTDIGELEGALLHYDNALAIDPNMAKAYYGKYKILSTIWEKRKAIEYLDKAIELDTDNAVLYLCRKSVEHSALKEDEEPLACLNKAYGLAKIQGLSQKMDEEELLAVNQLLKSHEIDRMLHNIVVPLEEKVNKIASILELLAQTNAKKAIELSSEECQAPNDCKELSKIYSKETCDNSDQDTLDNSCNL